MSNKSMALFFGTVLPLFCYLLPIQALANFSQFTGIWVRKDIVQKFQTTQSFFQVKKYAENQAFANFMAVGIRYDSLNHSRLNVDFTRFGAPNMPTGAYLNLTQKPINLGYRLSYHPQTTPHETVHLSIKKGELWVHVQKENTQKWLVFEKMALVPSPIIKPLYGKFKEVKRKIIIGSYVLKDANNRIIQPHVWFDKNGLTNFPGLHRYNVRGGYWNSIHQSKNASKIKVGSLAALQALDQEDILVLYNQGDTLENKKKFALKKVQNGFHVYTFREREKRLYQLLYKSKLLYKLVKKW